MRAKFGVGVDMRCESLPILYDLPTVLYVALTVLYKLITVLHLAVTVLFKLMTFLCAGDADAGEVRGRHGHAVRELDCLI